ncbi:acetyl-CoA carboxylase biotin carboxyl carrier protein subunit [Pseudonocardia halophobica]|uniref:acetyl-CoA carboxylase biotin carboxyl carrier protein subunit n=1 Tax=Pseudonocardia halophobica TaxID=29401 RepID=UPI003D9103CF
MTLQISLSEPREVRLARSGDAATVWIDGLPFPVRTRPDGGATEITIDGRREKVWVVTDRDTVFVHAFGRAWALDVINPLEAKLREGQGADSATAPMPGVLVALSTEPGAEVVEGQVVAVIESMKMQTEIKAPRAGVVERVPLAVGESFGQGAPLVVLASEEAE